MSKSIRRAWLCACTAGVLVALATGGYCAQSPIPPVFYDGFESSINGSLWTRGPGGWGGVSGWDQLQNQNNHIRTPGVNGAREWAIYRNAYNSMHVLPTTYDGNVYLKCWIFEDNDIPYPYPLQPGHSGEEWPNAYIALLDTTSPGAEALLLGVMGEVGRPTKTQSYFNCCCAYTATDNYQVLDGQNGKLLAPRRQGWRKYTILINGYTGNAGDVQFFVDDKLAYNGHRAAEPYPGAAPVNVVVLGSKWWTYETYYFDQVEFGAARTPINCATISAAKALPDGEWVNLDPKVVLGRFTVSPLPGYFAIGDDDRSSALWVSSSYLAQVAPNNNTGEKVQVKGIMRTNEAGMRYLDAISVTKIASGVKQPKILGTALKNLDSPLIDGRLVKVCGKVDYVPGSSPQTVRGQERSGDWRRYFLISDGSPGGLVKCYYDNIISGIDPIPVVNKGDFVSVIGVAGKEVLIPGTTGLQKSVWIRGSGDLVIIRRNQ